MIPPLVRVWSSRTKSDEGPAVYVDPPNVRAGAAAAAAATAAVSTPGEINRLVLVPITMPVPA